MRQGVRVPLKGVSGSFGFDRREVESGCDHIGTVHVEPIIWVPF